MEHKKDLRIIKTENNIRTTFIQLINEKDFNSITVQDILDRALINRSTFYKHYTDKYNLAETIAENFIDEFKSLANFRLLNRETFKELLNVKNKLLKELYAQKMTILGLWKIHTEKIHVYDDMQAILKQRYIELIDAALKENNDNEYESYICASILLSTLKFILEGQRVYTVNEITDGLRNFHNSFVSTAIKNNE
ncbi:TetR family transcriptional regulator [Clostridium estertheticum]|uniref:TetR/AcrR family transcriptional regulator n=1 Tax=Clostridium estertheticum TaxID=238834 RepID=UPI0013E91752|nr:TetR family transcriptional regulator [Clostridium estertheticum]MBZ9685215.1 TetR family transcriptional regulator [Clostridium estertheticum]